MRGRPSKFKPEFVEQAKKLANLGATDREIAEALSGGEDEFSAPISHLRTPAPGRRSLTAHRKISFTRLDREEAHPPAQARPPDDDGRAGHGLVGDDRPANRLDRPGRLHPSGISADDHRKSRCVAAIGDRRDDRARQESGTRAMAQARYGECAAAATEDLSRQLVVYPLLE